jgi:hypothetical protein
VIGGRSKTREKLSLGEWSMGASPQENDRSDGVGLEIVLARTGGRAGEVNRRRLLDSDSIPSFGSLFLCSMMGCHIAGPGAEGGIVRFFEAS